MFNRLNKSVFWLLVSLGLSTYAAGALAAEGKPNVLLVIFDDLRTELPAYGKSRVRSPNIDRFAEGGVVFENAYANVPVCGASRASLMTGIRPAEKRFVGYQARIDEDASEAITLFGHLKEQGYHTESIGKVVHFADDSAAGWSVKPWHPRLHNKDKKDYTGHRDYQSAQNVKSFKKNRKGPAFEAVEVPDNAYYDGKITERAIAALNRLGKSEKPFFLALGFLKPHLPFNAPSRYWNLYEKEDLQRAEYPQMPENAPKRASHNWGELRKYADMPKAPQAMPDAMAEQLIHGYYASISYVDAQIGKVLNTLQELGLKEDTLVFLIGDHGWSLGEHGLWAKHSPFDVATRTPLIVRVPGAHSGKTEGLVEFIDIYPTVLDLIGLPRLAQLQGESFVAQLKDINAPGKDAVFIRWQQAEVIKTRDFAFTEWFDRGKVTERMLYDHRDDRAETVNVKDEPEYQPIVEELHQRLVNMMKNR